MRRYLVAQYKLHKPFKWQILAVTVFIGASSLIEFEPSTEPTCTPISPLDTSIADKPCFKSTLDAGNLVTFSWRTDRSASRAYIFDDTGPSLNDPGVAGVSCRAGAEPVCHKRIRVTTGALYRWQLMVEGADQQRIFVPTELQVVPPAAPSVISGDEFVDILNPGARVFSWTPEPENDWSHHDDNPGWVEIRRPGWVFSDTKYSLSGPDARFEVPESALRESGAVEYGVRECHENNDGPGKFCSAATKVKFWVGNDIFLESHHLYTNAGETLEITFTTKSGDMRFLTSDSLIRGENGSTRVQVSESSYSIDGELLTPGTHQIQLSSCTGNGTSCGGRVNSDTSLHSGTLIKMPAGAYKKDDLIAMVVSSDNQNMQAIYAPEQANVIFYEAFANKPVSPINKGDSIAYVDNGKGDILNVIIDSPVSWDEGRNYLDDFSEGAAYFMPDSENALDIIYGKEHNIWLLNEFSNSVESLSKGAIKDSLEVPLLRQADSVTNRFKAVEPFQIWLSAAAPRATTITSLAERLTDIDGKIWFTQGGGLNPGSVSVSGNHSRIVAFDPSTQDSPNTLYDDRFCVYNLPPDNLDSLDDNHAIGLTTAGGRIWIGEIRGFFTDRRSVLSSFVPAKRLCNNLIDFNDPTAVAEQALQYCDIGKTPEQDGCIEKVVLPADIKIAHVETDPIDESIWFSDASGQALGNFNPRRSSALKIFRLPDNHRRPFSGMPGLGGFPWRLQVDDKAVYFVEYATRHIIRFDKKTSSFDEIQVPFANQQVRLHSLALDKMRNRLWFTLCNESKVPLDPGASTLGFIDLGDWEQYIDDPVKWPRISAVIYSGLENIPPADEHPDQHQSFRGLAVSPTSGDIALATMHRSQITVLKSRTGFWP